MKKVWEKPELVVLVRARPEESVLEPCKIPGHSIAGPGSGENICKADDAQGCPTCSQESST